MTNTNAAGLTPEQSKALKPRDPNPDEKASIEKLNQLYRSVFSI